MRWRERVRPPKPGKVKKSPQATGKKGSIETGRDQEGLEETVIDWERLGESGRDIERREDR